MVENYELVKFSVSDQLFFDALKIDIRGESIKFSSHKKRERDLEEETLKKRMLSLEIRIEAGEENLLDEYEQQKYNFESIREYKLRGIMLRANVIAYEHGEKPSRYFCNLEKKKYVSKTINKVNVNGLLIRDPVKILKEQKKYYENLYEEKDPGLIYNNEFLATQNVKKLSDMQKLSCEGLITLTEIKYVIKNAKNNKSPGCDGIPWEFYKIFYKDISIFLLRSLNDAFANKNLSITQKQGIITCLPKGDKPREYFKNWRPITLLNCDYKILSGVLANRMKNVLPDIIGEDQKGFIKGRFMGENTRVLYDVMEYLIHSKKVGLLLLIDFEKAFDSLKFSYIREILKHIILEKHIFPGLI
jgi:hypothetical protein